MAKDEDIKMTTIDGQMIVIGGIGKLYYQDGFPIPMAISHLKKKGAKVSILHIADELLKNGWRPDRVHQRLKAECEDVIAGDNLDPIDWEEVRRFCYAEYEDQREMIFRSLFTSRLDALNWIKQLPSKNGD